MLQPWLVNSEKGAVIHLRRPRGRFLQQRLPRDDAKTVYAVEFLSSRSSQQEHTIGKFVIQPLRLPLVSIKTKYESRDEVEKRLKITTLELLLDLPPDDITVRQIAEKSECHHPNIATYFGSKAGLYEAIFPLAAEAIAQTNIPALFVRPSKELVRLVRLAAWLESNSADYFHQLSERPLLTALSMIYTDRFKINEADAHLLAQRLVALMMGAILYPSVIGLQSHEFEQQFNLEMRIMQHLAADTRSEIT